VTATSATRLAGVTRPLSKPAEPLRFWPTDSQPIAFRGPGLRNLLSQVRDTTYVVADPASGAVGLATQGVASSDNLGDRSSYDLVGILPPLYPEWLGDRSFLAVHGVRFPYAVGEMATGIATASMVVAAAKSGVLGFFGAAGLALDRVEQSIVEIEKKLNEIGGSWGVNLIHSLDDPAMEDSVVDLCLRRGVDRISASAFMALSPAIVRFAASGLHLEQSGRVGRRRFVFAKISRPEVAAQFLSPAPAEMLAMLVRQGALTDEEARLAAQVPVAEDITVEADSGGHTDNRPLVSLLPVLLSLRDEIAARQQYSRPIRVGAAGGIGTPTSVAAAFSLGAAYVMTGSINQSAVEAGTSDIVKEMLTKAELADVTMAPAADMFELGIKVQVLKRGTMFAVRASRLYQVFAEFSGLDAIPKSLARQLEQDIFRASFDQIWQECVKFWTLRDPAQLERAERNPKQKMALVFRWYLGNGSRWAMSGTPDRRLDYQIWCGPAMGAFNAWVKGSFLAERSNRTVGQIAANLMEGAAVVTRAQQLRTYGVAVPPSAFDFRPRLLS
jgi:trans-AT polyketide synthase/acyltransferase/oxidoreductase domain-containing protein